MIEILVVIFILAPAIILHECAHGWAAYKLGDSTAKDAGRLTLNPLKHIDPVGTIIFPGILLLMRLMGIPTVLLGWAKPVPVNFSRLYNPKRDMIFVALAGPATNILIAVLFAQLYKFELSAGVELICMYGIFVNLLLATFNMIPIPPLDGSRLVMGLLPDRYLRPYVQLEPYGIMIVLMFLYAGLFDKIVLPIVEGITILLIGTDIQ